MNLNKRTTAYKLYAACFIMTKKLFGAKSSDLTYKGSLEVPSQFGLCPAVRTVLWTIVYLIFLASAVGGLLYSVLYMPLLFGGIMGYINSYVIPGAIIAAIIGVIWGGVTWNDRRDRNKETWEQIEARHEKGNYTLWETFVIWVKARHHDLCPTVTVVDEPVKPVVVTPVAPTPSPVVSGAVEEAVPATDSKVEVTEAKDWVESVETLDDGDQVIPEPVVAAAVEEEYVPSVINVFLAKHLPNFQLMAAAALAIIVAAVINFSMANVMQQTVVVFEEAACTSTYDTDAETAQWTCGEYTAGPVDTLEFVTQTVLLKKTSFCSVKQGTYTEKLSFSCEYK